MVAWLAITQPKLPKELHTTYLSEGNNKTQQENGMLRCSLISEEDKPHFYVILIKGHFEWFSPA